MLDNSQMELARFALNNLQSSIYQANVKAGWYKDPRTGRQLNRNVMEMLMLITTEVAEAAEGWRKKLNDNHLPEYPMIVVELADTLIRCFDLAGYLTTLMPEAKTNIGDAFVSKLVYNSLRADHQLSERAKPGGKSC